MTPPIRVAHVATVDLTVRHLLLPQLRRLRDEGYDVTAISAPGPWVADVEREGIRHIAWPHATRSWDPGADALAFLELVRMFRRGRFDLLHTHNPKAGFLGRIAARIAGVPVVVNTVHGFWATPDDPPSKRLPILAAERLAAALSDLELFQSEEDLAWARRIGLVHGRKGVLLGNGTDVERFAPATVSPERRAELRTELGIPGGAAVVGTVGRLVAEKGYRELFEAATRMPGVTFLVVGGTDPDKLDAIGTRELERAPANVVLAGWRSDVRDLLGTMDVFVLPSWREGLPRSAIEAAAMGLPLVLTDIRGCREVIRDGVEGSLVPPRDPPALAKAIERLVQDPELRARMGAAARRRAEERFDERRVIETILERYRALLQREGLRPPAPAGASARIRPAHPEDAPAIARMHRVALPNAFLPALGDRFLARLYRSLASDPSATVLVADEGGLVVGFAAGTAWVRRSYARFAARHGAAAALSAAPNLLRPGVLRRVRETATYPGRADGLPGAELVSIAVEPGVRGGGLGRALVEGVRTDLSSLGVAEMKVVVEAENEPANRFYESVGFRPAGSLEVHAGAPSNVWVIECRSSSHSPSPSS